MAGRASIVGAAETDVGNVRDHNEDCHFIDPEAGIFIVCDGMGGHAAGEVASAIAVHTIRTHWMSERTQRLADMWIQQGSPEAHKQLLASVVEGVVAAHEAIVDESDADTSKIGMGTTLVGGIVVGGEVLFAHAGDSRAYLVRDGIAMQLTEDQTLLARLLAAGVDVDVEGEGSRFRSMLTNAIGIGMDCKVVTFVVPLADGDRFLLCSDGIHEYLQEPEIGEVLCKMPSPARAAQRLVELALERGGADNATALVVRVLEAGDTARPSELLRREELAIKKCPLWSRVSPQQRLRALRIALPREYAADEKLPAQTLGDRVAWVVVEGELEQNGMLRGPGSLIYPEALLADAQLPGKDELAIAQSELRLLALRADDFRELCEDDAELGEALHAGLAAEIDLRNPIRRRQTEADADTEAPPRKKSTTDRGIAAPERPSGPHPVRAAGLIAPATEVAGDLDRAMDGLKAPEVEAAKQLEPADDEDAEIVVEAEATPPDESEPDIRVETPSISDPEIEIETIAPPSDHVDNDLAWADTASPEAMRQLLAEEQTSGAEQAAAPAQTDDESVHELIAEEPSEEEAADAEKAAAAVRALSDEDDLDAEWEHPETSEIKAVEAIAALEAEQAEEAVAALETEQHHARTHPRAISEPAIEERHELEVGELDDEDNSGRVVEVLKDTSSQTITMTSEPAEAE